MSPDGTEAASRPFSAQIRPQGHISSGHGPLHHFAIGSPQPQQAVGLILSRYGARRRRVQDEQEQGAISSPRRDRRKIWCGRPAPVGRRPGQRPAPTSCSTGTTWFLHRGSRQNYGNRSFCASPLEKSSFDDTVPRSRLFADRWLLLKLSDTVSEVTEAMECYQFDRALKAIREFSWDVLADNYIELVKGRLYSDDQSRDGACHALSIALDTLCRMMAPFTPHFAEECYSYMDNAASMENHGRYCRFLMKKHAKRRTACKSRF